MIVLSESGNDKYHTSGLTNNVQTLNPEPETRTGATTDHGPAERSAAEPPRECVVARACQEPPGAVFHRHFSLSLSLSLSPSFSPSFSLSPTVLRAVGPKDYPHAGYARDSFDDRCVVQGSEYADFGFSFRLMVQPALVPP